jgi:hypothetical protein
MGGTGLSASETEILLVVLISSVSFLANINGIRLTAHQSIKGLPRWGVLMEVNDRGTYSVGRMWVIKCRPSSPPMEWAMRLMPLPRALC